jgi:hypothetical protein
MPHTINSIEALEELITTVQILSSLLEMREANGCPTRRRQGQVIISIRITIKIVTTMIIATKQ